jgi:hypothetical protein
MRPLGRRSPLTNWGVPTPYPDELGYSVVARYLDQWGRVDPLGLLRQTLYRRVHRMHPSVAPCISALAVRCSGAHATSEDFIRHHSLVPYHLAFEQSAKRQAIQRALHEPGTVSAQRIDPPYPTKPRQWLRLCRQCERRQRADYGECYWRRIHQLPGLSRCIEHRTPLSDSPVPFETDSILACTSLTSLLAGAWPLTPTRPMFAMSLERRLAERSRMALELRSHTNVSPRSYRRQLLHIGFAGRTGELRATAIGEELAAWTRRYRSSLSSLGPREWWLRLMTGIGGRRTTLQHLVLAEFLNEHGAPAQADR